MTRQGQAEFTVKLAQTDEEIRAAQRLRYQVFVQELGGQGALVDHSAQIERDRFDPYFDHLICQPVGETRVIGAYRLLRSSQAARAGGFYSEGEYDLTPLKRSQLKLLEVGRSCVHADFRSGTAMHCLWKGLARYCADHQINIAFGVASFHGVDIAALAGPLSLLHQRHLAPPHFRVKALGSGYQCMDLIPADKLDRRAAMVAIPSLIKSYLKLGGTVGDGAFVDRNFNTTDVFLSMDTKSLMAQRAKVTQGTLP